MPAAIPLVIGGVQTGISAYGAYKNSKAQGRNSAAQDAALRQSMYGLGQAQQRGGALADTSLPYFQQAGNYYQTLLRGNRGAMNQAVAGPAAQIGATYRGAQSSLLSSTLRGGARDTAMANLNRDRAASLAGLTTGVQPMAANQLAGMGQQGLSMGMNSLLGAASGMQNAGSQYGGNALAYGQNAREDMTGVGAGVADLLREIMRQRGAGGGGMAGGSGMGF